MGRLFGAFREWPVSARVASGVLSALVVIFLVTTVLTARNHDKTHLQTSPPTTSTTVDTVFLTTLPPPSSTSTSSTTAKPGTPTTTRAPGGAVVVTTAAPPATQPPSQPSTPSQSTTSTSVPAQSYCAATVTSPHPAAGASETVNINSTLPDKDVTLVVHYRTGDVMFPASGQTGFKTDAAGHLGVSFTVSQGSKDYPVIVDVTVGTNTTCETNFRPSS